MSFLRDRLKQIAQELPKDVERAFERPSCAETVKTRPIHALLLTQEGIGLMAGAEAASAYKGPRSAAFLDIETTGLSHGAGTVAFEIGIGLLKDGSMEMHQLYMRDYDEERDLLERAGRLLEGITLLVTFNGRSFDLPMLQGRMIMNRLPPGFTNLPNLDLLHPARRLYKIRLRSCSLASLEEKILLKERKDDIPGAEIPGIWTEFLKTRDEGPFQKVLEHNLEDVYSMPLLLQAIHDAHQNPQAQMHMEDVYSMGRVMERAGRIETAEQCYRISNTGCLKGLSGQALSRVLRRQGRVEDNVAHLCSMLSGGDLFAYVELAKIYEHQLRDYEKALEMTDAALTIAPSAETIGPLKQRRLRLARRIEKRRSR